MEKRNGNGNSENGADNGRPDQVSSRLRRQVRQGMRYGGGNPDAWKGVPRSGLGLEETFSGQASLEVISQPSITRSGTVTESKPAIPDPLGAIRLSMFSSERSGEFVDLIREYAGGVNVDALAILNDPVKINAHEDRRQTRYLEKRGKKQKVKKSKRRAVLSGNDANEYADQRGDKIEELREVVKARINERVYGIIKKELGLSSDKEAADVFDSARQHANDAILGHARVLYPGEAEALLRDEVRLRQRPADLLELALRTDNTPKKPTNVELEYELRRQAVLTAIALQHERGLSTTAADKMTQLLSLMDEKFYKGETGETQTVDVYGVFDNNTNALVGDPLIVGDNLIDEAPSEPAPDGTHYKVLSLPVRKTNAGPYVLTLTDEKDAGAANRKAVRYAQGDVAEGKEDVIPTDQVTDRYRMKIVVLGEQQVAEELALDIFTMALDEENYHYFYNRDTYGRVEMVDGEPTGAPVKKLQEPDNLQESNKEGKAKSKGVKYVKLTIPYENTPKPLKVTVQSIHSYLREMFEIGEYDQNTGWFDGPAWELYEIQRELPEPLPGTDTPVDIYYPGNLYDLEIPYAPKDSDPEGTNPKAEPYRPIAAKAQELLRRNIHVPKN